MLEYIGAAKNLVNITKVKHAVASNPCSVDIQNALFQSFVLSVYIFHYSLTWKWSIHCKQNGKPPYTVTADK